MHSSTKGDRTFIPMSIESHRPWVSTLFKYLKSIKQNYNFDMLATIWHEIVSRFLMISQDLQWFAQYNQ